MRKFYIPYIVFCILLITLFIVNMVNEHNKTTNYETNKIVETGPKTEINKQENFKNIKTHEYYIVRALENNIYLYDKENNIINKLNIDYENLREYDKNQFNIGIKLTDMSGVYQLIEDFSN